MVDVPRDSSNGSPARDERLAALLARYDEAAAAGQETPGGLLDTPLPHEDEVLLADARDCLQLLQDAWWPDTPTIERSAGDVSGTASIMGGADLLRFGRTVGRFEILRELGRGGFGIVFLAYDPRLKREIALKVPRPEAVWSPERRARFVREGQAAASLNHPNIVTVFEADDGGAICCLAAEYIQGPTLSAWLREQTQPVAARTAAQWLFELASAIQHAHERGVLHRDLKPSNVLLATVVRSATGSVRGAPQELFTPKLTDFGLALWLEGSTEETQGASLLGTPRYMAPEQLRSERKLIGAATDVYGLGAVLYEMLTGQAPFWGDSDLEILRRAADDESWALPRLRQNLPRDLRTICEKCLEREPHRRYASAAELANDLQRFLSGKPILARPTRIWERAIKWGRRRPAVAALSLLSIAVTMCLFVGAVNYNFRTRYYNQLLEIAIGKQRLATAEAEWQKNAALAHFKTITEQSYVNQMLYLSSLYYDRHGQLLKDGFLAFKDNNALEDIAGFEWRFMRRMAQGQRREVGIGRTANTELTMSPNGTTCAVGTGDGWVSLVEPRTAWEYHLWQKHSGTVTGLAFSPDSRDVASAALGNGQEAESWLRNTGRRVSQRMGTGLDDAWALAFSPDGSMVATAGRHGGDAYVVIHDTNSLAVIAEMKRKDIHQINSIVFSPDGKRLFLGYQRQDREQAGGIVAWSWNTREFTKPLEGLADAVRSQVVSPNGEILVATCWDNTIRFWRLADGKLVAPPYQLPVGTSSLEISADGEIVLVSCVRARTTFNKAAIFTFDTMTGQPTGTLWPPESAVNDVALTPDNELLVMACEDGNLRVRELGAALEHHTRVGHQGEVWTVDFSPDGLTLVSGGDDHRVVVWNFSNGQQTSAMEAHDSLVTKAIYSPDGKSIASVSFDGSIVLWDAKERTFERRLTSGIAIRSVVFSPNGQWLATGGDGGLIKIWDVRTGRLLRALSGHADKVRDLAFLPDDRTLISVGNDGQLIYWDAKTGKSLRNYKETKNTVNCLALSHDGQTLATGTRDGAIHLREAKTGKLMKVMQGHASSILCLAFSADDRTLASGAMDYSLRLWNVAMGREVLAFRELPAQVNDLTFSPANTELVAALHDGSIRVWHTKADFWQSAIAADPRAPVVSAAIQSTLNTLPVEE